LSDVFFSIFKEGKLFSYLTVPHICAVGNGFSSNEEVHAK